MKSGKPAANPTSGLFWLTELVQLGITIAGGLTMALLAARLLDPNREERKRKRDYEKSLLKRIGRNLSLSPMESLLADAVVNPNDIDVSEEDLFGMEDIISDVKQKIIRPLLMKDVYNTTLWRQPRGVLLHGNPGTGKTMIAKIVAKTCGCFFLSISSSSIMSKWYGDAQKLVRAMFSLACKLEPCIIFIDEVDAFLIARGGASEHEATLGVKTEFMQCWEGISTSTQSKILVMGATNRKYSLDAAVLRRFSMQKEIPMPSTNQRLKIIKGYMQKHCQEIGCSVEKMSGPGGILSNAPVKDNLSALEWVAKVTENYSGSDLHELCANAAKIALVELLEQASLVGGQLDGCTRIVSLADFETALQDVKPVSSEALARQLGGQDPDQSQADLVQALAYMLQSTSGRGSGSSGDTNKGTNGSNT